MNTHAVTVMAHLLKLWLLLGVVLAGTGWAAADGLFTGKPHTVLPPWDGTVWNNPPDPPSSQLSLSYGRVTHATFHSNIMATDIGYSIYLPLQYATQPTAVFPVVYWLNGRSSTENWGCGGGGISCDDTARADGVG